LKLLEATQEEIVKGMKGDTFKTTIVGMGTVGSYIAAEFLNAGAQVIENKKKEFLVL
jgi:glutamate dehydrogenase/leucine dehydrogenase